MNRAIDGAAGLCGFLNINKPIGWTSREALDTIARPLKRAKIKAGHAGTLDPLASGVLVIAVGDATRLIEHVQHQAKTYTAVIRLGARSDTDDADGTITETPGATPPSESAIQAALGRQLGTIDQLPPRFSAIRVDGKRSYDLARSGQQVELTPRPVRIDRIDVTDYNWPRLTIRVDCGSGTYIRSIARDLGDELGCGGLIEVLTRTRIGRFEITEALDPAQVSFTPESIRDHLIPAVDGLDLPRLALDSDQLRLIAQGRELDASRVPGAIDMPPGEVALIAPDGRLVAVGDRVDPDRLAPRKVLASQLV